MGNEIITAGSISFVKTQHEKDNSSTQKVEQRFAVVGRELGSGPCVSPRGLLINRQVSVH